jgi:hypothetical protein
MGFRRKLQADSLPEEAGLHLLISAMARNVLRQSTIPEKRDGKVLSPLLRGAQNLTQGAGQRTPAPLEGARESVAHGVRPCGTINGRKS